MNDAFSALAHVPRSVRAQAVDVRKGRLVLMVFGMAILALLLYRNAFAALPSADDYILAGQIRVGESRGTAAFFTSSPLGDFRPLQSLTYWAVGRWNIRNPFPLVHALNFVAFGLYAAVFIAWVRLLRLPSPAVAAAVAMLFLHPALAGPLADLDGFSRFVVAGWVWLGVYCAFRYANRLAYAIPLTALCFVVGLGFMEYAVALIPLGPAALWWARHDRRRAAAAVALLGVLMAIFAAYYAVRLSIIAGDSGRLSIAPVEWATNLALLAAAVLYMGDSVATYVSQSVGAIIAIVTSVIGMTGLAAGGLWLWYARQSGADRSMPDQARRASTLLPFAIVVSFFPMVLMTHVSEIYTTPIVFPFALMIGTAMAGWISSQSRYRHGAVVLLAVMLVWASSSIVRKVGYLKDTGDRAQQQIESLLASIPAGARDARVGLVFLESELPPRRTYSVFRAGDDHLIQPGQSAISLIDWFRPGRNIELVQVIVPDVAHVRRDDFDLLLQWDSGSRRFRPLSVS